MAKGLALPAVWSCDCASLSSSVEWGGNRTYFTWVMWELNSNLCKVLTWQINTQEKQAISYQVNEKQKNQEQLESINRLGWMDPG